MTGAAIAFFDFDNTLMEGDAGPLFGWYLFRWRRHDLAGHFWRRMKLWGRYVPFITWMGIQGALYKLHARRRSSLIRASYKGLRGQPAGMFYKLMDDFATEAIVPRLYPEMVAELKRHLEAGNRCIVVTTGMEGLVQRVVGHVDARVTVIGCRLMERNGKLTGRIEGPLFGVDKANIMDATCRAYEIEPQSCWAYSDHWSDKQMLDMVGHRVAVNPRGRMARLARKKGWQVIKPKLG